LKVFENRVLRKIFGPKSDELRACWRKLHNEELHNLCSIQNIFRMIKSRRIRLAGHVTRMGEKRNTCRILVGQPEGERPVGRQGRMWVDNIKMDLRDIGWSGGDWIDLHQDRDQCRALANTTIILRVPQNVGKFWSRCTTGGVSSTAQLHGASYLCVVQGVHFTGLLGVQNNLSADAGISRQTEEHSFGKHLLSE
jgi:hypothetical protein